MPTDDAALSQDVEALRERFTQTQELYREVCALLFFRYGITPTANKLYQLVRKGSMSAPAEALSKFWQDLREKSRTRIEHPDLPENLKNVAGELIATLWTNAQAAAQESLDAYRVQAEETVLQAKAEVAALQSEREAEWQALQAVKSELKQAGQQISTQDRALAVADANYASLLVTVNELKHDNSRVQLQLEDSRREFNVELDKLRAAAQLSEERSQSTEKRMLVDIDRERTASAKLQKELEAQVAASSRTAQQHRQECNALQQALGDSREKNGQLEGALQAVTASLDLARLESRQLQTQLNEAQVQIVRLGSQADDLHRQLEETQRQLQLEEAQRQQQLDEAQRQQKKSQTVKQSKPRTQRS